MLELNDIKKDYVSGSTTVSALKGVDSWTVRLWKDYYA